VFKKATSITANNITFYQYTENNQGLVKEGYTLRQMFFILNIAYYMAFLQLHFRFKIGYISENLNQVSFRGVVANNCRTQNE
jgi:hypothetical protein